MKIILNISSAQFHGRRICGLDSKKGVEFEVAPILRVRRQSRSRHHAEGHRESFLLVKSKVKTIRSVRNI